MDQVIGKPVYTASWSYFVRRFAAVAIAYGPSALLSAALDGANSLTGGAWIVSTVVAFILIGRMSWRNVGILSAVSVGAVLVLAFGVGFDEGFTSAFGLDWTAMGHNVELLSAIALAWYLVREMIRRQEPA